MDEFNWGWSARLPLGPGGCVRPRSFGTDNVRHHARISSWRWGVGDGASSAFDFSAAETEKDDAECGSSSAPFTEEIRNRNDLPDPRWTGKAPHTMYAMNGGLNTKSARWDVDWWRMRLCGDPRMIRPRVPYGKVFQPGSMDGLWHGRILVSDGRAILDRLVHLHLSVIAGIRSPRKPNYRRS